jgi:hypothetical protein
MDFAKEYYIGLLRNFFIYQIDIPTYYLQDEEIKEIAQSYNWTIDYTAGIDGFSVLKKKRIQYD